MNMVNTTSQIEHRYWWVVVLRGIFTLIFGLIVLFAPVIALLFLIYLFAAYAVLEGIMAIVLSIEEHKYLKRWWVIALEGVVGIVVGIIAFAQPGLTALALLYLVAIWAIITGVLEIGAAIMHSASTTESWLLGVAGVLSIAFGIILFAAHPLHGILALLWLFGIYTIIFGVVLIMHGFQLKSPNSRSVMV